MLLILKRAEMLVPNAFPVSRVGVPVDVAAVRANETVNPEDSVVSPMTFEIPQKKLESGLTRSDLMILEYYRCQ